MKYRLKEKPSDGRMMFKVTIVADANDGDYITTIDFFPVKEFEECGADALIDLLLNYSGSHQLEKYPNEGELDIPFDGWDGYCHTLESVEVEFIDEFGKTWDVELILEEGTQ